MIRYWLQNGETFSNEKDIKEILEYIFQKDGKFTQLGQAFFKQLNKKNLDEIARHIQDSLSNTKNWKGKEPCSICGNKNTDKVKQWIYPFAIAKDKFPNLHPNGKVDSLHLCRGCAEKSVKAYGRILFKGQKDYLCFILFFATTSVELRKFYNTLQQNPIPNFYSNLSSDPPDIIYYPYEFLASEIYNIVNIQSSFEGIDLRLGAIVFGLSTRLKKIFDTSEVVDNIYPIIKSFVRFSKKFNSNNFEFLFRCLREDSTNNEPGVFINRNLFFKSLLKDKKISWTTLEEILFYNIRKDRNIPFIKPFLVILMEELHMAEKEIFEQVSTAGYSIGKSLLDVTHDKDKAKRYLYELRRKRRLEEFLDTINLIQLESERNIDDRQFKEHSEIFPKLRVFFLIGMTNAIFAKNGSTYSKGEGDEG
ncbi:MAG: hypothetical protein QW776_01590 [Candidatus Nitrosocaldus sp.]